MLAAALLFWDVGVGWVTSGVGVGWVDTRVNKDAKPEAPDKNRTDLFLWKKEVREVVTCF